MRRIATAALVLAAVVLPAAAQTASTALELDRMQGTRYPGEQTRQGKTWTLTSIYAAAEVTLEVDESDEVIPALTGDEDEAVECITNAELDALAASHRESPVPPDGDRSFVYGVVVDAYAANDPDDCRTGVLGRMWDSEQRSAFAIYYKTNTISTDGEKYLRTTAHELGHAFNLHHEDGDGKKTIMNQTSVVGDNFTYDFSAHSQSHLGGHPGPCNLTGGGAFYGVDAEHVDWHGSTFLDCADEAADGDDTTTEGTR
ncbi:MAG TPA: hypothetical protein VKU40_03715 [Thermoanaerobaculia bacterium]|nr:hypothetical protein [Thermoanaerobaculia bacterium]